MTLLDPQEESAVADDAVPFALRLSSSAPTLRVSTEGMQSKFRVEADYFTKSPLGRTGRVTAWDTNTVIEDITETDKGETAVHDGNEVKYIHDSSQDFGKTTVYDRDDD